MFKKTLLALAIAGFATSSMAALTTINANGSSTVTGSTSQTISFEGAQSSSVVSLGTINFTLGTNTPVYTNVSGVTVTITGGTLAPATAFDVGIVTPSASTATDFGTSTGATIDYPTSTSARLVFAAANKAEVAKILSTDSLLLKGLAIIPTSLAVGSKITIQVDVLSAIPGSPLDTKSGEVAEVVKQFSLANITSSAAAGNEGTKALKVDVSDGRNTWNDGTTTAVTVDTVSATLSSALIDILPASAVAKQITYVLTGSVGFGFLDADSSGAVDTGTIATTTTSPVLNTALTTITETAAAIGNGKFDGLALDTGITETVTFDVSPASTKYVIAPQSLSLTATLPYADATAKAQSVTLSDTAGSWTLNGSSVTIPYMPFGTNTQVILRATNTSAVAGDLTVRYMAEGSQASWKDLGVIGTVPAGVTNVSDLVINAIKTDMGNPTTGQKVALELTTNSPSSAITFFAGFKVLNGENDRGIVGTFGAKGSAVQSN